MKTYRTYIYIYTTPEYAIAESEYGQIVVSPNHRKF